MLKTKITPHQAASQTRAQILRIMARMKKGSGNYYFCSALDELRDKIKAMPPRYKAKAGGL